LPTVAVSVEAPKAFANCSGNKSGHGCVC
jgi:hypothetical protein